MRRKRRRSWGVERRPRQASLLRSAEEEEAWQRKNGGWEMEEEKEEEEEEEEEEGGKRHWRPSGAYALHPDDGKSKHETELFSRRAIPLAVFRNESSGRRPIVKLLPPIVRQTDSGHFVFFRELFLHIRLQGQRNNMRPNRAVVHVAERLGYRSLIFMWASFVHSVRNRKAPGGVENTGYDAFRRS
ncbi:hypothetical protein EYF80_048943 [Liparis tanakae]|uniref:Uncharacterized protein n=1 Tax=Liparis tanakae TaxID=230148 RepID=A0A4Z2FIB7_9TELE|nr:hypothetical protein EYF80_048943 [Liparis tanakae]